MSCLLVSGFLIRGYSKRNTLRFGAKVLDGSLLTQAFHYLLYRYLIWIGSDQDKTFGPTISGLIKRNIGPERLTLWDSKERGKESRTFEVLCPPWVLTKFAGEGGRPDVMKLIKEAYYAWGAEVVFITSNWQGNKEMMEGCKEAGIPAFVS